MAKFLTIAWKGETMIKIIADKKRESNEVVAAIEKLGYIIQLNSKEIY